MGYFKNNTSLLKQKKGIAKKLHCLPIYPEECPKGFRVLCANTHIGNIIGSAIPGTVIGAIIGTIAGSSLVLPFALATFGVLTLPALISQADARDFVLVKKGNMNDGFWPEDAMMTMNIYAINDGVVVDTFNEIRNNDKALRQNMDPGGNHITIQHDGFYSFYAHLSYNTIKVTKGQKVKKGQIIGKVGDTGNSSAPHLHFEMVYLNSPQMLGIVKPLTGFESYKSTPIPWKDALTADGLAELLQKYYNKPSKIDNSGVIDSLAYIGD